MAVFIITTAGSVQNMPVLNGLKQPPSVLSHTCPLQRVYAPFIKLTRTFYGLNEVKTPSEKPRIVHSCQKCNLRCCFPTTLSPFPGFSCILLFSPAVLLNSNFMVFWAVFPHHTLAPFCATASSINKDGRHVSSSHCTKMKLKYAILFW